MRNSVAELNSVLNPQQRERKFLMEDAAVARAVWAVAESNLRPEHQDPERPFNYVRTSYFDTLNLDYFKSARGPVQRRMRVREYAAATSLVDTPVLSGACYVEVKESASGMRTKLRVPMRSSAVGEYLAKLPDAPLVPVVTTWYRRSSLTDSSERLRVTLDEQVAFCSAIGVGAPCDGVMPAQAFAQGPRFVLEIKLWDDAPAWLASELRALTESIRFSKFSAGMRAAQAAGLLPAVVTPSLMMQAAR